jgi:hypothetical protein
MKKGDLTILIVSVTVVVRVFARLLLIALVELLNDSPAFLPVASTGTARAHSR